MSDKQELLPGMDPAAWERVARHLQGDAFVFDLEWDEYTVTEGNTVYHMVPRYAAEGESVVSKLRRILARELEKSE